MQSYFQHAILIVEDLSNKWTVPDMKDPKFRFQNFDVFVGNDPDYTKNTACPGGPFQNPENVAQSFTSVSYNYPNSSKKDTDEDMWNHGAEIWCNLEGQYTHIVADLSGLNG